MDALKLLKCEGFVPACMAAAMMMVTCMQIRYIIQVLAGHVLSRMGGSGNRAHGHAVAEGQAPDDYIEMDFDGRGGWRMRECERLGQADTVDGARKGSCALEMSKKRKQNETRGEMGMR